MTATLALICVLLAGCTVAAPRSGVQPVEAPVRPSRQVASVTAGLLSGAPLGPLSETVDPVDAVERRPLTLGGTTTGVASWFGARGYQGAVPWWRAGQRPVWATVSRFADGKTYSVTVLVTGFCQCLVGQPGERLIDLSPAAFRSLGAPLSVGLIRVTMTVPVQGPRLPATDSLEGE